METIKPVRIQRKRVKGFNMQKSSPNGLPVVYVGYPSKWANPFLGDKAANLFDRWLSAEGYLQAETFAMIPIGARRFNATPNARQKMLSELNELKGKNLACWCQIDKPCHVDTLLKLANK